MKVCAARVQPKSRSPGYYEGQVLGVAIVTEQHLPNDYKGYALLHFMSEGGKSFGPNDIEDWCPFPELGQFDCVWPQGE